MFTKTIPIHKLITKIHLFDSSNDNKIFLFLVKKELMEDVYDKLTSNGLHYLISDNKRFLDEYKQLDKILMKEKKYKDNVFCFLPEDYLEKLNPEVKTNLFNNSEIYKITKEPNYIELRELQDKVLLYFTDAFHNFNWNNPLNLKQKKIKLLSEQIQTIATAVRMLSSYNPQVDLIKVTENEYLQVINFINVDLRQITEKMQPLEEGKAGEFLDFILSIVRK